MGASESIICELCKIAEGARFETVFLKTARSSSKEQMQQVRVQD